MYLKQTDLRADSYHSYMKPCSQFAQAGSAPHTAPRQVAPACHVTRVVYIQATAHPGQSRTVGRFRPNPSSSSSRFKIPPKSHIGAFESPPLYDSSRSAAAVGSSIPSPAIWETAAARRSPPRASRAIGLARCGFGIVRAFSARASKF